MNNFNKFATNETPLTKQKEVIGLDWLKLDLPKDEVCEDDLIHTEGDQLIEQFYNGNWSKSVQTMKDNYIRWDELLTYMQEHEIHKGWFQDHQWEDIQGFDYAFWGELGYALGRDS